MRLFRMIVSIFVMLIAGLIGFFVGIRIDEAMGGAVLFSVIAGIACVIYTKLVDCLEKCLIYGHIRRFAD